jgi:outer membrane protein
MKQLSLILNIVLLLAVGFLYYLHFSSNRHDKRNMTDGVAANKPGSCATSIPVIAYVDQDSLSNNVSFIKNKKDEFEAEQRSIQSNYENEYKGLEMQKDEFLKKGNAITQQEADEFQQKYIRSQQEIEGEKQSKTQALAAKNAKFLEEMQGRLKDFLDVYNKQKKFTYILATGTGLDYLFYKDSTLNITDDVVKGLNDNKINQTDKP